MATVNPDEISHVAQWVDLTSSAKNNGMFIALHQGGFGLWKQSRTSRLRSRDFMGTFFSFFDLRRAMNDYLAAKKRGQF